MSHGTTIVVADDAPERQTLREYVRLSREISDRETQLALLHVKLKTFAEGKWLEKFAATELLPDTPFKIAETGGAAVTFAPSDRTGGYDLDQEQFADLAALLGHKATENMVHETRRLDICKKTLAESSPLDGRMSVADFFFARVADIPKQMLYAREIDPRQSDALAKVVKVKQLRPKLLGELAVKARIANVRIIDILTVLGSAVTRTIKA